MLIKQISVFAENKPGRLLAITKTLADAGIDIRALSIADTTDFGILRLIVSDPQKALEACKEQGFTTAVTQVIAIKMQDKSGALYKVLDILNNNEISVEYAYAYITHTANEACVILRVENNEKALKALGDNDIVLVSEDEVYSK